MEPYLASIELMGFPYTTYRWAACDGSLLPVSQNNALYTLLGAFFGGDGRVTFALPDLRGRMPVGQGIGAGLTPRRLGDKQGNEVVELLTSHLPPHEHQVSLGGSTSSSGGTMAAAGSGAVSPMPSGIAGQGAPLPIMPPSLTINFQIALTGVYPSRD